MRGVLVGGVLVLSGLGCEPIPATSFDEIAFPADGNTMFRDVEVTLDGAFDPDAILVIRTSGAERFRGPVRAVAAAGVRLDVAKRVGRLTVEVWTADGATLRERSDVPIDDAGAAVIRLGGGR